MKCRSTTHYGGYIVAGSFARNRGTRRILVRNAKAKQKRHKRRIAEKKIVRRDKLTVYWTQ